MQIKSPLFELTWAHIREYLREPGALFWSFGFPVLMAIGLGFGLSGKKEIVRSVAIVPNPGDTLFSQSLGVLPGMTDTTIERSTTGLTGSTHYIFKITSWEQAEVMVKRGLVAAIMTEKNNQPIFHIDPTNPEGELLQIQMENYFKTGSFYENKGTFAMLDKKGLRYIDFLIPGLLSMGIMMSVMWGVCYSLIEKRSKKLLRRMIATPMRRSHFLLSQWLSRILITLIEMILILYVAKLFFDIEVQGSTLAALGLFITGNFCFFGLAILISSRTANTQVGNGLVSFVTTPMMVLSGIFFSYQSFPDWAIIIIKLLPLTMLTDALRAVINEGAGFSTTIVSMGVMTLIGIFTFLIGKRMYKWY